MKIIIENNKFIYEIVRESLLFDSYEFIYNIKNNTLEINVECLSKEDTLSFLKLILETEKRSQELLDTEILKNDK